MSFDIEGALNQMADAMQLSLASDAADIQQFALKALTKQKSAFETLANAVADGEIDQEEFQDEVAREMLVVETELLAVTAMGKAMVQKAINAAINTFMQLALPI